MILLALRLYPIYRKKRDPAMREATRGEFFVEREDVFDALTVGIKWLTGRSAMPALQRCGSSICFMALLRFRLPRPLQIF